MKSIYLTTLIVLIFSTAFSQKNENPIDSSFSGKELKGVVIDFDTKAPLPYANIFVLQTGKGTISNEIGHFTLNIDGLENSDTLRFQYVGYKTRNISLAKLEQDGPVYLQQEIINLNELLVFATEPDVVEIVKNVLRNKDKNYLPTTSKNQAFIRDRNIANFQQVKLNYKKSSIDKLDRKTIEQVEEKIPRNLTSYTDFLGNLYFNKNKDDSVTFKIDPIRTVALKEQDLTELDNIAKIFESAFANTNEDEYWKVKSGIFGQKMDSADISTNTEKDSLDDNQQKLSYYRNSIKWKLGYTSLENKKEWEFLYSTGKYNYTLTGGTRVNGEDVYVIDFTPKKSGMYQGRMFVAIGTFALIRADYEYAADKTGTDFHLLGVGYTETDFSGSIYFEKKDNNYLLKYFSTKSNSSASFDRSVALLKKQKRWLFDKTLKELKIGLDLKVDMQQSIEFLVLNENNISQKQFDDFKQPENLDIIYVDQFNENLWKDYSIIEPTEQMKEYKKQGLK